MTNLTTNGRFRNFVQSKPRSDRGISQPVVWSTTHVRARRGRRPAAALCELAHTWGLGLRPTMSPRLPKVGVLKGRATIKLTTLWQYRCSQVSPSVARQFKASTLRPSRRKLIPLPNSKRWMLRPPLTSRRAFRRCKRAPGQAEPHRAGKDRVEDQEVGDGDARIRPPAAACGTARSRSSS